MIMDNFLIDNGKGWGIDHPSKSVEFLFSGEIHPRLRNTSVSVISCFLFSYDECEAKAARETFDKLVEVSGKYNGIMFVEKLIPKFAKKGCPPKKKPEPDEDSETEQDPETHREVEAVPLPKEQLLELRKTLIAKYPRLDNPLDWDLEYMDKAYSMPEDAGDKPKDTGDKPEGISESRALIPMGSTNAGDSSTA